MSCHLQGGSCCIIATWKTKKRWKVIMEIKCNCGRCMEMAQVRFQWHNLLLAVMNHRVVLPDNVPQCRGSLFEKHI
jgi:hypothetical protein